MGSLNPLSMIIQIGLGALTGGASMLLQAALKAVVTAIAQEVIQQLGKALGLPQGVIDIAKQALGAAAGGGDTGGIQSAVGNLAKLGGASAFETGKMEKMAYNAVDQLVEANLEKLRAGKDESGSATPVGGNGKKAAATGTAAAGTAAGTATATGTGSTAASTYNPAAGLSGPQSFLVRLAIALGKVIDAKQDDIITKSKELDQANAKDDKAHTSEISGIIQGLSQEISMLSAALSNSIKSIGEATSQMARKG